MALQVWLPLNGSLRNQGVSGVIATNSGATVDNSGKIGKCYSFDGSDDFISFPGTFFKGGASYPFSICMWIYQNDTNRAVLFGDYSLSGALNFNIELRATTNPLVRFYWGGNPDMDLSTIPSSQWVHLCITYDGSMLRQYNDGVLVTSKSATLSDKTKSSGNFYLGRDSRTGATAFAGKLNDFRMYDHCLSPKEVKEIAKGLVLNYKLSDIINTNLLSSTPKAYSASSYNAYQLQMSENLQAGQTYTMQLWDVNVSHTGKTADQLGLSVYWGGGSVNLKTLNGTSYFTNGHVDYLTFSFTPTSSQASGSGASNSWLNIYNSVPSVSGTMNMHIGAWKLEKGSVATGLFGDLTKEYDCSGYSNNGDVTGTLTTNSDSPRYSYSTGFTGTQYIHLTPPTTEVKTISLWAKWNSIPSGQSVILVDYGSQMGLGLMSTGILCSTSNAGYSYTFPKSGIVANTWYHFVIIKTGTTARDLYINGVKQTQTSNTSNWTYSVNELQLGKRSTTSDGFNGKLSDFRAYVTILSDDDVKELYNTSAFLTNNGTLFGYELVEAGSSEINKNGIVGTGEFTESDLTTEKMKIFDDEIQANIFNEI